MNNARAITITFFVVVFFSILVGKLFNIQVTNHETYKFLAERQQNSSKTLVAERGTIIDKNGEVLAYTKEGVSFFADTRMLNQRSIDLISSRFAALFDKDQEYYKSILREGKGNVCLERRVPKEIANGLSNFVADGLFSKDEHTRVYPYGKTAAHVLGYVNNEFEGVTGIEKACEDYLSGKNGSIAVERDVRGRLVAFDGDKSNPAHDGKTIQLTINKTYQNYLAEELEKGVARSEAKSATGIIVNPMNGEILALANYPDFEPANYFDYSDDVRRNRAVTDTYEPGSTMKSVMLAVMLEEGIAKPDEMINTENGKYKYYGVTISDEHQHQNLSVTQVLEQSSNIGMAKLSERLDANVMYKYLRDFGFGNTTAAELPGEVGGTLKKPSTFSKVTKSSISRGYAIAVNPLQMVAAYSSLVNGGILYKPHFIKQILNSNGSVESETGSQEIRRVISPETSEKIKNMMMGVVEKGTGKYAQLENVYVGGKTGTAKKIIDNKYSNEYNSSFIGFFPVEEPQIVCYILVDSPKKNGRFGGSSAAPIFRNVASKIVEADINIVPDKQDLYRSNEFVREIIADASTQENEVVFSNIEEESDLQPDVEISDKTKMPNLKGKSIREAVAILTKLELDYKITGEGKVSSQSLKAGRKITPGMICEIICKANNKNNSLRLN